MANFMWDFPNQKPIIEDKKEGKKVDLGGDKKKVSIIFQVGLKESTLAFCEGSCGNKTGTGVFEYIIVDNPNGLRRVYRFPSKDYLKSSDFIIMCQVLKYIAYPIKFICESTKCIMTKYQYKIALNRTASLPMSLRDTIPADLEFADNVQIVMVDSVTKDDLLNWK